MKFSCTQENLNQILNIVSHIASKNNNLPILSNLLIKTENKNINISATNLEVGITSLLRGKVDVDGEILVDAKLLSNYISLLDKDRVDFELIEDDLKIECKKQKTKIKTQNTLDFPLIPKIEKSNPFIVSALKFKNTVYNIAFAVSNSDIRPEISGVFMSFLEKELVMAATDSYRLAEKKIDYLDNKNSQNHQIIVPVKTLQEVSRIIGGFKGDVELVGDDNLEIYIEENQIIFNYNGVELISRLIDGQYPDYNQIIPNNFNTKIKVNVIDLIKAVKASSLFAKSGVFDIKMIFSNSNNLSISASSSQVGENNSNIDIEKNGPDGEIVINYKYILDGLQNIQSEFVVIEIIDSNTPIIIKPEDVNDYLYLIMPIRQ